MSPHKPKPPAWVKFKPRYRDAPMRFVDAIRSAKGRNLLDELLDPWRAHIALGEASPLHGTLPAIVPLRAPPCHTAAEIASLWPLITKGLLGYERAPSVNPGALRRRLRALRLPEVRNADGKPGHIWAGKRQVYFWTVWPVNIDYLTQSDFERIMRASFMEG
jgi:hypothetical protein